jgi:hypothetical protein
MLINFGSDCMGMVFGCAKGEIIDRNGKHFHIEEVFEQQ